MAQISDGAAQTLLFTEVRTLDESWDSRGAWALGLPGTTLVSVGWFAWQTGTIGYDPHPNFDPADIALPNSQTYFDTVVGVGPEHCVITVRAGMPALVFQNGGPLLGAAPRSLHSGGVFASLLNGQVRFLADAISPLVYVRLVYPRDGRLERTGSGGSQRGA